MSKKLPENEVTYLVTQDYINKILLSLSQRYPRAVRKTASMFIVLLISFFTYTQVYIYTTFTDTLDNFISTSLPAITIAAIYLIYIWALRKSLEIRHGGIGSTGKIIFNDDNLISEHNGLDSKIAYSVITKAILTKNVILLIFKNKISLFIPIPATSKTIRLTKKYISTVIDCR